MGIFHFLNVGEGDCSIIQHASGRVSVIDVCNGNADLTEHRTNNLIKALSGAGNNGNFRQAEFPVNPIEYMTERGITEVFRFISTHPDMDHLDGFKAFCAKFPPVNFWCAPNTCEKTDWSTNRYRKEDWDQYCAMRGGRTTAKVMNLHAGDSGAFYNADESGPGGDGLAILAPTIGLARQAEECGDYNDASYVILYRSQGGRILICGDSHDKTWEHIIANHKDEVSNVDLMIAPHHGRHSDRDFSFLNVVRPKVTLFGTASSDHLAYEAWRSRKLRVITSNQADCVIVDSADMSIFATNQKFAATCTPYTFYSETLRAHYIGNVATLMAAAA